MNMTLKLLGTGIFVVFGLLSAQAVWNLGFGWYGLVAVLLMFGAVFAELWIFEPSHERYKQAILDDIEGYRGEDVSTPQNLLDAKELVTMLKEDRDILADAYVELVQDLNEFLQENHEHAG